MLIKSLLAALFLFLFGYVLFRVIARREYLRKGKLSFISSFLEFVFFALHANAMYLFIPVKWPRLPSLTNHPILYYPSLLLIIIGLLIVCTAMIPLGYRRTMGVKSNKLKVNGLYKYTRNPQLIGYYLILIGFILSYPSLYAVGWLIVFSVISHLMVITEEEYLTNLYGREYQDYFNRIPRYLSFRVLK